MQFESRESQHSYCAASIFDGMSAPVRLQNPIVKRLRAELYFRCAEPTQATYFVKRDVIGSRLHDQADVTMLRRLVDPLRVLKRSRFAAVQRIEASLHK